MRVEEPKVLYLRPIADLPNAAVVLLAGALALAPSTPQFRAAVLDSAEAPRQTDTGRRIWSAASPVLRLAQQPGDTASATKGAPAAAVGKDGSAVVPPIQRVRPKPGELSVKIVAPPDKSAPGKGAAKSGKAKVAKPAAKAGTKPAEKSDTKTPAGRSLLGVGVQPPQACAPGLAHDASRLRCVPVASARAANAPSRPR